MRRKGSIIRIGVIVVVVCRVVIVCRVVVVSSKTRFRGACIMLRIALLLLCICLYHNVVSFASTGSSGSVLLDMTDDLVYSDKYKISFVDTT